MSSTWSVGADERRVGAGPNPPGILREGPGGGYTGNEMDWWVFHEAENPSCEACVVEPVPCGCGEGLVHTQFTTELDAVEGRCDVCHVDVPAPLEVD